jgi:hypothetical protein
VTARNPRIALLQDADPDCAELVRRLLRNSARVLPQARDSREAGEFAFTLTGVPQPDGGWRLAPAGTSIRYTAIAALGLLRLPAQVQQQVLGGGDARELVGRLAKQLDTLTGPADVALVCWAAAEAGHSELHRALARLAELDDGERPLPVVAAAWVVTALVAARQQAEVERLLAAARRRLLAARGVLFPHTTGGGPRHRVHVGSFADQVYPVQALARLHASDADREALAAADEVAAGICQAQGQAGQWWWHYDARTGAVVEGYPVYSVHQYAMAPMALLDLAEAGGQDHLDAICQGLRWQAAPPETATPLIFDDPPVCWRKVARGDRRKLVRGVRAALTRLRPGLRLEMLDWLFPPGVVDRECRPYEPGWLLYAWLPAPEAAK